MSSQAKIKNGQDETLKAGCAIINDRGEILLVSTYKNGESAEDKNERVWAFPKGHAEHGETLEQTAKREAQEETGYAVDIVKRLSDMVYAQGKTGELIRVAMFEAKPLGDPQAVTEKIRSQWFSFEEAKKIVYQNLVFIIEELSSNR